MMNNSTRRADPSRGRPSADDYAAFIDQIDLESIWLHEARVLNRHGAGTPRRAEVKLGGVARFESREDGFDAFHRYELELHGEEGVLAEIAVTFALRFESKQPMTDRLFELFQNVNLPVNTWPYLREFVASAVARMGWETVTLPALKRGTRRSGRARRPTKSRQ